MGRKGGGRNAFVKATLHKTETETLEETTDGDLQKQAEPVAPQISDDVSSGEMYKKVEVCQHFM